MRTVERRLLELNLRSARRWPAFAGELHDVTGIDVGYRRCGTLLLARDRDEAEAVARERALRERLGLRVERLLPSAAPVLFLYARAMRHRERERHPDRKIYAMAAGYIVVWALFSLGATALQRAQAIIARTHRHPYYWAAFGYVAGAAGRKGVTS